MNPHSLFRFSALPLAGLLLAGCQVFAQPTPSTPPAQNTVAATVNGQPIYEVAVQRGLARIPPVKREEARPELLKFLIDNLLIEQHLQQAKVAVEDKEIDDRIAQMKAELEKQKQEWDGFLKKLNLTEAELRTHITADLRWEKFVNTQATDEVLTDLFNKNKEIFDGTAVRARHILLSPPVGEEAAQEAIKTLTACKQQVEAEVAEGLAKVPADKRDLSRGALVDESFSKLAKEKSVCPSKARGGDVGMFQRIGFMVEPFAKAAFALQPYQMSEVVQTQFGYHLILVTERRTGKEVKFEEIKAEAREIFAERLQEKLAAELRARSKIEVMPAPKLPEPAPVPAPEPKP